MTKEHLDFQYHFKPTSEESGRLISAINQLLKSHESQKHLPKKPHSIQKFDFAYFLENHHHINFEKYSQVRSIEYQGVALCFGIDESYQLEVFELTPDNYIIKKTQLQVRDLVLYMQKVVDPTSNELLKKWFITNNQEALIEFLSNLLSIDVETAQRIYQVCECNPSSYSSLY